MSSLLTAYPMLDVFVALSPPSAVVVKRDAKHRFMIPASLLLSGNSPLVLVNTFTRMFGGNSTLAPITLTYLTDNILASAALLRKSLSAQ